MTDFIKINVEFNFDSEEKIKRIIENQIREKCYIIVKRIKSISGKTERFEVVDDVNKKIKQGTIISNITEDMFEKAEIFGDDPDVRKISYSDFLPLENPMS